MLATLAVKDANGNRLDGAQTYRVTLPPDIPAARFWSLTLYDNKTRSMLETPQWFPRAGSQSYPTPGGDRERGRLDDHHLRPAATRGRTGGQLDPDSGGQGLVHAPAPLEPALAALDKTWRPSEIEPI